MNENYWANITVPFKYVKELPKLVQRYNVKLDLPVVISPDGAEANLLVHGTQADLFRFIEKLHVDMLNEIRVLNEVRKQEEGRDGPISKDDVTNVKILLNTSSVEEFIRCM